MVLANAPIYPVLPAVNLDRARKFYSQTLGLREIGGIAPGHAIFACGRGTKLIIYERKRTRAEHTVATFRVANVEKVIKKLRAKRVKIEEYDLPNVKTVRGVAKLGLAKSAWFTDPEGNIIAVSETL